MPNPYPDRCVRLRADAPRVVARLNRGETDAVAAGKEYGVHRQTVLNLWAEHATREQRARGWRLRLSTVRRGRANHKYAPVGTLRIHHGRRWIKVRDDGPRQCRWVAYSHWLYLRHVGPVPRGHRVFHRDDDRLNDAPANLILLPASAVFARNVGARSEVAQKARQRAREGRTRQAAQAREIKAAHAARTATVSPEPAAPVVGAKALAQARVAAFVRGLEAAA